VLSVAVDEELLLELTTLVAILELDLELMTELDLELLIELDDLLELITLELDTLDLLLETVDEVVVVPHKLPFTFGAPAAPVA
jgi:hypothetical protein